MLLATTCSRLLAMYRRAATQHHSGTAIPHLLIGRIGARAHHSDTNIPTLIPTLTYWLYWGQRPSRSVAPRRRVSSRCWPRQCGAACCRHRRPRRRRCRRFAPRRTCVHGHAWAMDACTDNAAQPQGLLLCGEPPARLAGACSTTPSEHACMLA